jgi:hypothetical protein
VVVDENRFGRGPITSGRVAHMDAKSLQLIHTAPQVAPTPASFVPTATRGIRPPEESLKRPVVATRPPHRQEESASGAQRTMGPAGIPAPAPRLVSVPQKREPASVLPRPPLGQSKAERPTADLARPPSPPRIGGPQRPEKGSEGAPAVTRQAPPQPGREKQAASPSPAAPQPPAPGATTPPPSTRRAQAATPPARPLPGEPANRLAPTRAEKSPPQQAERKASPKQSGQRGAPEDTPREPAGGR